MSDMSEVQEAISSAISENEVVQFRFEVDGSERIVGVSSNEANVARILIGKSGTGGPNVTSIRSEDIVSYSVSNEVLKRGLISRFLGKDGAVRKLRFELMGGEDVVVLIPAESRAKVKEVVAGLVTEESDDEEGTDETVDDDETPETETE